MNTPADCSKVGKGEIIQSRHVDVWNSTASDDTGLVSLSPAYSMVCDGFTHRGENYHWPENPGITSGRIVPLNGLGVVTGSAG